MKARPGKHQVLVSKRKIKAMEKNVEDNIYRCLNSANILKLIKAWKIGTGRNTKAFIYPCHFPEKDMSMPNKAK